MWWYTDARSISNKTTAVNETIVDRRLDVLAVTETWHHSSDDICLRLAAPDGYSTVETVRVRDLGHGGIAVFYCKRFTCTRVKLPTLTTFESICVQLSADDESFTVLTIYRPGSVRTSNLFYDELSTVLELLVLQSGSVVIGGDFNIHVELAADADAPHRASVFDAFDLRQHIASPTHCLGGILDLIATFIHCQVEDVAVDPADVISDHSLVTCSLPTRRRPAPAPQRTIRCWHTIDRQAFTQAVRESILGSPPPSSWTADKLFTEYDRVLRD